MQLNQIRSFLAVRDAGSLRAAARQIGISQPAISKAMAALESELQASLFVRTSRGVRLTEAGRLFASRAAVIQAELGKVREDLAELSGYAEGTASVGIGPAVIPVVASAFTRFHAERPNTRISVREGTREVLLPLVRDGSLDFAIAERGTAPIEGGLASRPLWQAEIVVVARRGHPLALATSLAQLVSASWLMIYRPGAGGLLERACTAAGLPPPNMQVHCESHAAALALIAGSDLLGLVPIQDARAGIEAGRLQRVDVRERLGQPRMAAFTRADTSLSAAARQLLAALVASARGR